MYLSNIKTKTFQRTPSKILKILLILITLCGKEDDSVNVFVLFLTNILWCFLTNILRGMRVWSDQGLHWEVWSALCEHDRPWKGKDCKTVLHLLFSGGTWWSVRNEKINILSRLLRTMVSSKGLGPAQEIIRNKKGAKQLHRDFDFNWLPNSQS